MPAKKKSPKHSPKPRVHRDLQGFEVTIDSFGELKSNLDIEKINEFLNRHVADKKLAERKDYEELRKGKKPDRRK
jgi:hypothetical protein